MYTKTPTKTARGATELGVLVSIILLVVTTIGAVGGCMYGYPKYKVYKQKMQGTADFKEAEINRQIQVEEARAKEEALMMVARGNAERIKIHAQATEEAISKIGEKLNQYPDYLRYHWIEEVAGSVGERIYIPTEAGMPILEARSKQP